MAKRRRQVITKSMMEAMCFVQVAATDYLVSWSITEKKRRVAVRYGGVAFLAVVALGISWVAWGITHWTTWVWLVNVLMYFCMFIQDLKRYRAHAKETDEFLEFWVKTRNHTAGTQKPRQPTTGEHHDGETKT